MNAHRIEAVLAEDKKLILEDLPFRAGDTVEVIVLERAAENGRQGAEDGSTLAFAPAESGVSSGWLADWLAEIDLFWEQEGERPDIPRDWAANFKEEKRRRILNQNHE